MTAIEKIDISNNEGRFICVGLDTDVEKIPIHLKSFNDIIFEFNKQIIETTSENTAAYKFNLAFYESEGINGIKQLEKTLKLIPEGILTIGDAKRGDIGNTSKMYAKSLFEHFNFDATTLSPYMGYDSISPFLDYEDKLHFILALTSNQGADDFEKVTLEDGKKLYELVINKVNEWNTNQNCGIVFGATQINELEKNISTFEQLPVLVPGIGVQGGSLEDVIEQFSKRDQMRLLINVSRSIIYKDNTKNFAIAANDELKRLNAIINNCF